MSASPPPPREPGHPADPSPPEAQAPAAPAPTGPLPSPGAGGAETGAGRGARVVALGILASRVAGFLRTRTVYAYFGVSPFTDVFLTALRAPNVLQILLGEGTLSASFIPVYSRLLAEGRKEEAGRFAGAVLGLLLAVTAGAVVAGMLLAPALVAVLTPGFLRDAAQVAAGEAGVDRYRLAVAAVRIIFPMTGLLVLSAWALGVLNSHRRFFLSYFAPVLWNAAIIAALLVAGWGAAGGGGLERLLFAGCFGALAGGLLQFLVQLPLVARLLSGFRLSLSTRVVGVRQALGAFAPVVAARGVVQLSSYLDVFLASQLVVGAIGALGPSQYLYMLPVSLFGMSVAAAELPELSRAGDGPPPAAFLARVGRGLGQGAFLTVPTAVGYLAFGLLVVGALFETGRFSREDTWLVYLILCGYSLGLVASTASRMLQNTFYALRNTRTPARIAIVRVSAAAAVAVPLMLWLDRFPVARVSGREGDTGLFLGAVGLSLASAVGAWLELALLRRALGRRLAGWRLPLREVAGMMGLAAAAVVPAAALWWWLPPLHPAVAAVLVVGVYAGVYLGAARALGLPAAEAWLGRLVRRRR